MLMLLRGLPASGKSTFIDNHKLRDYTVSSDNLRQLLGSNELQVDGTFGINQNVSKAMWGLLYDVLERRFQQGAFTVLDSTNIKTADMQKVNKLAKQYRYRVYCVDFTDVSVEECIRRDGERPEHKQVGESVIRRMGESLRNSTVPGGIKVIKPEDWLLETRYRTIDLSKYEKVVHIGDIHGCYTALQNYLKDGINPNYFYIFIGDYIDRGLENIEMVHYISELCQKENVVILEGNHEKNFRLYLEGEIGRSVDFENTTRKEFDEYSENDRLVKDIKTILSKLRQCVIYKWNGKVVLCTHGGLSKLPSNLSLVNAEQLIRGVGQYKDMIEVNNSFAEQNKDNEVYQVHGHRNIEQVPIKVNEKCFNLCEHIEFGGNLRCLELDKDGFHEVYTPNPKYRKKPDGSFENVGEMLDVLDMNDNIKAVKQEGYNITSYNFSRNAFNHGIWDEITTKARGLFINNNTSEIVARGYDKFFNINERPETNADVLPNTLSYPVEVYKKENGFLGLLGFDKESDSLLFCSKSEIDGTYSNYFKNILLSVVKEESLYNYMKPHNVTLVFEVIDVENDPHIIKYQKSKVVLLDIIENDIKFSKYNYTQVKETADLFGLDCKELCKIINSGEELSSFFKEISKDEYKWKNRFIEGFVFVDSNNFMFKYKCEYYKYWKVLRSQVEKIKAGGHSKIEHPFIDWVLEDKARLFRDIISLREEYQKTHK
jgi:predicted kinase